MKMLSTKDAADALGVSRNRVLQLIDQGTLKATKVGRDYVIDEGALSAVKVYGKAGRPPKDRKPDRPARPAAKRPAKRAVTKVKATRRRGAKKAQ